MTANNNWVFWIFAFIIISSIVGGISFALIALLGLPSEWGGVLSPLLTIAALYMVYRRYPLQTWALVGCVAFVLIGAVGVISAFTSEEPEAPSDIPTSLLESPESLNFWGLFEFDNYYDYVFETNKNAFVIEPTYSSNRTQVTVQFASTESLDGQWGFQVGSLRTRGALNGIFQADRIDNWLYADEVIFEDRENSALSEAHPYLVVNLPLGEQHRGKSIQVEAQLTLVYPDANNQRQEQTLTRQFDLYLPNADFHAYREQHRNWERTQKLRENPILLGGLALAMVGAAVGAGVLWRQGALHAPTGSLIVEVRRSSGLQRMGMEAHTLKTLSDEARAITETGVFVGVVNAQSPAGRADIRSGDVLTHFAGKPIKSPRELNRAASRIKRGEVVQVSLIRGVQAIEVFVKF